MPDTFPVIHSVLSPQSLADKVLPAYGLAEVTDCQYYSGGFNDTYRLQTRDGRMYYMRIYRKNWRTRADIGCELDALDHLRRKGIPVAYPLHLPDGQLFQELNAPEGTRYTAVFQLAPGEEPTYEVDAEAKCFTYGKNVARMHNALEDFSSPSERFHLDLDHFIDKPLRMIHPFLKNRSETWNELFEFATLVRRRIAHLPVEDLEWGFCHGDLQGYHHRIAPDGTLTFIDFDCGGFGFRAYDLAVLLWCSRLEKEGVMWHPYLAGYQEERELDALDVDAVPLFVACRYIWHMGVHCENAPDWGCDWLNDRYFDERITQLRKAGSDYGIN